MATGYTDLLNTLELTAGLPESSSRYSADDMCSIINKSLQQNVVPTLMQLNEEYLLTRSTLPLVVNGTRVYPTGFIPIPNRAYGQTIRAISFQRDGIDNATVSLPYVEVAAVQSLYSNNLPLTNGAPLGYHFFANGIQLIGDPSAFTGSIILHYLLEPSQLMNTDVDTTHIHSLVFNGTNAVATLNTSDIGAALATYITVGQTRPVDLVHVPTGTVVLANKPATLANAGGSLRTFTWVADTEITANKVAELNLMLGYPTTAGMYTDLTITPAGQSTITNLPKEYDNLLVLDTAKRIWASLGDIDKASQFAQLYSETRDRLASAMGNRSKGEAKTITNRNGILSNLRGRTFVGRRY